MKKKDIDKLLKKIRSEKPLGSKKTKATRPADRLLTDGQKEMLCLIIDFQMRGKTPSYRDLALAAGVEPYAVQSRLQYLVAKGYLVRNGIQDIVVNGVFYQPYYLPDATGLDLRRALRGTKHSVCEDTRNGEPFSNNRVDPFAREPLPETVTTQTIPEPKGTPS